MRNLEIHKEIEREYIKLLARIQELKVLMTVIHSGEYDVECPKSSDGWHQWRTSKVNEVTRIIEKCLPYCYDCKEVDNTNTKTRTPIVGDNNWHERQIKLVKKT